MTDVANVNKQKLWMPKGDWKFLEVVGSQRLKYLMGLNRNFYREKGGLRENPFGANGYENCLEQCIAR